MEGLNQQAAGSNQQDNESFRNETTIPLLVTQDEQGNSYSRKRSKYVLLRTDSKYRADGTRFSSINEIMKKSKSLSRSNRKNVYKLVPGDQIGA